MPPGNDSEEDPEQYSPKRVLLLSLPAALLFGMVASTIAVFNFDLPLLPPFARQIASYGFLPSLLVLVPLSIFMSWRARNYLRRFPKRDFAMSTLLLFNFFSVMFSILIVCVSFFLIGISVMFKPVIR